MWRPFRPRSMGRFLEAPQVHRHPVTPTREERRVVLSVLFQLFEPANKS